MVIFLYYNKKVKNIISKKSVHDNDKIISYLKLASKRSLNDQLFISN